MATQSSYSSSERAAHARRYWNFAFEGMAAPQVVSCSVRTTPRLIVLAVALAGTLVAWTPAQSRLDRQGDRLPAGALARLGTVRFRQGFGVWKAVYSPNGQWIASVGRASGLRVWDATTGRLRWQYQPLASPQSVAFSPDGRLLACQGHGPTIVLLDPLTGREKRHLPGPTNGVVRLAFSPDGQTLAVRSSTGKLELLDVTVGKVRYQLEVTREQTWPIVFSPDGATLAAASNHDAIVLWDVATGKERGHLAGHRLPVHALAFSPDGKTLASASADATVRLWHIPTRQLLRVLGKPEPDTPWPHWHAVGSASFSPDGKYLASGLGNGEIILRDAATSREIRRWHAHSSFIASLVFSPHSKTILTGGSLDSSLRQWDAATGQEVHRLVGHQGPVHALRFSADGKELISGSRSKEVLRWDIATGRVTHRFGWHTESSDRFAISPNGTWVATWSWPDNIIRLWNATTGKAIGTLGHLKPAAVPSIFGCMAFSPDGRLLAAADDHRAIRIWDVATRAPRYHLTGCAADAYVVAFSPDGKMVAAGTRAAPWAIDLWDLATGRQVQRIREPDAGEVLAFAPDGKTLVSVSGYGCPIRFWDVATGKQLRELPAYDLSVAALAFSPDGRFLAAGGQTDSGATVDVWEFRTGQHVRRFKTATWLVFAIAFSPDSLTLAAGNSDSTILLWDLTGRQNHGRLRAEHPSQQQLDAWWAALAGEPDQAFDAYWALTAAPAETVPFLASHLKAEEPADARAVSRLLRELDSPHFKTRQRATTALSNLGEAAAPLLRKALAGPLSPEASRRIRDILASWDWERSRECYRLLRAVDILARLNTPEARAVLGKLAGGMPTARLTQEARAALGRRQARP